MLKVGLNTVGIDYEKSNCYIAIVVLGGKMFGVMYHLLVGGVVFFEEGLKPKRRQ